MNETNVKLVNSNNDDTKTVFKKLPFFHPLSRRLHMMLMLMIGFFAIISMRINMGIAMTCMVNSTAVTLTEISHKNNNSDDFLTLLDKKNKLNINDNKCQQIHITGKHVVNDYGGELIWNSDIQGWLFSSIFYGSLITIIPAGYLADTQSPKTLITISVIIYTIGTIATPYLATNFGWIPLFICRIFMGLGDGFTIPSISKIVTLWIPIEEKSTAVTIYTSGFALASIIGVPIFAYLCSTSFKWPSIFYFCGIIGIIWVIFWELIAKKSPYHCEYMHEKEKNYLLSKNELQLKSKNHKLHIPFKSILTSLPFISLLFCAFSINIIVTFIHAYQPTFFKEVLLLSPVYNGIYGAIPPVIEIIFKLLWGMCMDNFKQKKILTPTTACKISQIFSGIVTAILFIILSYVANCEQPIVTLFIFCGISMSLGATASGFLTSLLSIAPPYTGMISSASMLTGILARVIVPILVPFFNKTGTLEEWRPIFFIIAGTTTASTLFFAIFGSGDIQTWAKQPFKLKNNTTELEEMKNINVDEAFAEMVE